MAPIRPYHCTAIYVHARECVSMLGDNSKSGGLNPWDPALRIVYFLCSGIDEEDHHEVERFYTMRPAKFPQDKHAVNSILSEQITNLETASRKSVDHVSKAYAMAHRGQIMLVCNILVDGGDNQHTLDQRLDRAPEEARHPYPVPLGTSAVAVHRPGGSYYVRFEDIPQPVLEEHVVGFVSMQPLESDSRTGDMTLDKRRSLHSQTKDGRLSRLFSRLRGRENRREDNVEQACELDTLYVNHEHHECLAYALVDTMIVNAKDNGYATMILRPTSAGSLAYAKEIFKKAGPDPSNTLAVTPSYKIELGISLKSPNPSAVKTTTSKDNDGKNAKVFEVILAKWPGPLDPGTLAKIVRRKDEGEEVEERNEGKILKAKEAGRRTVSPAFIDNTTSPYEYYPLDEDANEVRLLTLLPGPPDAEIRISLDTHTFYQHGSSKILQYEALSYSWGSTDNPGHVFIDRRRQPLPVTRNLAEALLHLRDREEPRHLWIDAICVNQADLSERGSQIKRMADIYKNAYRVIVWLGPGTPQSTEAMRILSWIGCTIDIDWFLHTISGHHDPLPESLNEDYMHGCANMNLSFPFDESQRECLLHLLSRSWFERLWIWQEIRLARNESIVQCGFESMSWANFSNAVFLMRHKNLPLQTRAKTQNNDLLDSRIQLAYRVCDFGVEDVTSLFEMTRFSKCSDPKDRVYSLLSLFDDTKTGLEMKPDYTQTVYEVYREATLRMLLDLGKLEILASAELQEEDEPELRGYWSTWVPDWSRLRRTWPVSHAFAAHVSRAEISHHGRAICMAGVAVAEIGGLCAFDPAALRPLKLSEIEAAEERYEATRNNLLRIMEYFSQEQRLTSADIESFCRTSVAGEDADSFVSPKEAPSVSYRAMQDILLGHRDRKLHSQPPASPHEHEGLILTHVLTNCEGRSVFRLRNSNFGFAPRAARESDIVVVFLGCDNPLVLRPSGSQYQLVGEAYCDGFMYGEALLGPLPASEMPVIQVDAGTSSFVRNVYKTGEIQLDDPRLGDLPPGWTACRHEEEPLQTYYTNREVDDGTVFRHDPRLTSSWLMEQGVDVQMFEIV